MGDMARIKNILFDFGGVIVDLNRDNAVKKFLELGVHDVDEMLSAYQQSGYFLELEDGRLSAQGFCEKLSKELGRPVPYEKASEAWRSFIEKIPAYKLRELEKLRENYKVFILSNTNPFVVEWFNTPAWVPEGRPLTDFADKVYASCEIGVCKPERAAFEIVLKDAGILAEETLFLDDGTENIAMAKSLGFHTYQPKNKEDWTGAVAEILGK